MQNAVILYVVAPYDAESMASFPFMNSAVHGQTSANKTKPGPSFSTLGGSVRVRLAKNCAVAKRANLQLKTWHEQPLRFPPFAVVYFVAIRIYFFAEKTYFQFLN